MIRENKITALYLQAVIQKCRKEDMDDRPKDEQVWCLYTRDGDKLLGRHPSKEKAEKQEKAVQYFKHRTAKIYTLYHGTKEELKPEELEERLPPYSGSLGKGIYFGQEEETAKFYGPHVIKVQVELKNPLIIDAMEDINYRVSEEVREKGEFDSILVGERVPPFDVKVGGKWHEIRDNWDLKDIGNLAKEAGHDSLIVNGIRWGSSVNEEVLVFDKKSIMTQKTKMASSILERFFFGTVKTDLGKAEKSDKPSVFLGGACDDDNQWRETIKKEFSNICFVDPYDPDWDPSENIYDELTGLMKTDCVVFYKGGEGSAKEKEFLDQVEVDYQEFDDLDDLRKFLSGIEGVSKTADFPDHPDDVVISKKENIVGGPEITELDVFSYYTNGVVSKMLQEFKGRELFIGIKPKGTLGPRGKPIYVRHPYDKKSEYIRINNEKDFEIYHSGRTVEYHVTMPAMCPYYVVDFDAAEDWTTTKEIIGEIADMLDKISEVKKVEIRYSGKRGFHVLGWLKSKVPIDKAREDLKEHLKETFGDRDDLVLGESPSGTKGALGVSPMKLNGGQVALWSLRITGLCCVEVPRAKLAGFKREDARPEKVYKQLTGKTLVPAKKKEAAARVVQSFLNKMGGYDRDKIKAGYKGKFVIHNHHADRAGQHFDLRIEFPVTSMHQALKSYEGKRIPGMEEPLETYPDKPGTVYRSFAVRKHKLPTADNKIFIVGTEDHPIEYGTFQGEISEGYGKGKVEVYDKGTYELLDAEGDKKYVIDFKGKKLNGIFALVKYQDGYLWVKTKKDLK